EDPERKNPVDQDVETLSRPHDLDGARSALGQGLANTLAARRRAPCRRVADVRDPEGHDIPIEEAERGGSRRRLDGDRRHAGGRGLATMRCRRPLEPSQATQSSGGPRTAMHATSVYVPSLSYWPPSAARAWRTSSRKPPHGGAAMVPEPCRRGQSGCLL